MLMLLAAITGRAKDEIDSEDIRQQRRFKLTAVAAGLLITVLGLVAVYGGLTAAKKPPRRGKQPSRIRVAQACSSVVGGVGQNESIDRAITLGVLAWRIARTPEAESALRKLQNTTSGVARILGQHTGEIKYLTFSGDSSVLGTRAEDGSIVLWQVKDWRSTGTVLPSERDIEGFMLD